MKVLESPEGQQSNDFNQVLKRRYFSNGDNMLDSLLSEGFIKKAATNNIIVKPNSKSAVRLDELNRIISDIANGRAAEQELEVVAPGTKADVINQAPVAAPVEKMPDSTELMMEMMKTMKAMQEEIAALKESKTKKTTAKTV
jgi:hypothetical protein